MPLNREIESRFIADGDYDYRINVVVEGGDKAYEILYNMSFDTEDLAYYGMPIQRGQERCSRLVYVRERNRSPSCPHT